MSVIELMQCDNCKKIADSNNHYKEGWIQIDGEFSRGLKEYKNGSYKSQWIMARNETKHFCSWECLMNYNDNH